MQFKINSLQWNIWIILLLKSIYLINQLVDFGQINLVFLEATLIYKPRIYLFGRPDCLRGLTRIGNTITPTVNRQIGATTINIDSRDMK